MQGLEKRIEELEKIVSDLLLEQHAARIAITVISSAWNAYAKQPGQLGISYDEAIKISSPIKFDSPVNEEYAEALHQKVVNLLSKSD
ncbi:TPA: hypothetical protein I8372_001481 [Citrobacter farmeri]|nr:hypothetical protein [Citrobacter farmeri]HAT2776375.1 hypothetical protein [Citrobacter farmeri]HAT2807340.1 hypothetical protein [Citrobacter farmeri]HBC0547156.1 hypothetical protein [Citrobacter farmeri]